MTSYVYIKNTSVKKPFLGRLKDLNFLKKFKNSKRNKFSLVFFTLGAILLGSAVLPIVQFQIEYATKFNQVVSPLSTRFYNNGSVLGELTTDYNQLNNWFVSEDDEAKAISLPSSSNLITYTLSIPKLKIKDAVVTLGSMDLKKSLIQYPQTALPGQLGNPVIFGHSVLPQFFNSKSYSSIFSTLFRLKPGDEVLVNYDHVEYKYVIEEMFEVEATNLSVLEQRFDTRNLTIITCSPPGTLLRRLVVKAKIADNN